MKRRSRNTLFVIIGFISMIALVLLFIQTAYFKEKLKTKLIEIAEKQIDYTIDIEELEGNLFSHLSFRKITIYQKDSTLAHIPSLYLEYDLWELQGRIISIDSVLIEKPEFNFWQNADSTWNVSTKTSTEKKKKGRKKPFEFELEAKYIAINHGSIQVSSNSKIMPQQIHDINIKLTAYRKSSETKIHLQEFNLITKEPALELKELTGIYTSRNGTHQLDSLTIKSGGSNIDLDANYSGKENMQSLINAGRIDNSELAVFIPSFKLLCSPAFNADLSVFNDSVSANARIVHNKQSIAIDIELNTLENLLSKKEPVPYFADLKFENFEIKDWIETNIPPALIDGKVRLEGTDLLESNSYVQISADLTKSSFKDVVFDTLTFKGSFADDSLHAFLDLNTKHGDVQVSGILDSISTSQHYEAKLNFEGFNLTTFFPKLKETKVNGAIIARGKGLSDDKLFAEAELHLTNSSVYMLPIDTLHAEAHLDSMDLEIDSLHLFVPGAELKGGGSLSFDSLYLDTKVAGTILSTRVIDSLVVLPIEFDSVYTVSSVRGPVKNLAVGGDVKIYNAAGYSSSIENAHGSYLVSIQKDSVHVSVDATTMGVQTGDMEWDTTIVDFDFAKDRIDIGANVIWTDTLNAFTRTSFTLGDTMHFEVPMLEIRTLLSDYYMPDTMKVELFNNEKLEIRNFVIKDRNDADFILYANGIIASADTNHFEFGAKQFDIKQLNRLFRNPDSISGVLETDISITGSALNPTIRGSAQINQPKYGKFYLSSVLSNFSYSEQNGYVEITSPELEDSFYASLHARFNAYFDSLKLVFDPPETFDAKLIIDSLRTSPIASKMIKQDSVKGIVHGELEARGDFDNPQLYGNISLKDGQFLSKRHGIDYERIDASVSFKGNSIGIDNFDIKQKKGIVSLSGDIDFDSTMISGNIKSSSLQLEADQFYIAQHRNYEVLIDANSFINTADQKPEFGGKIKVIRSDIYLPAIIPEDKTDIENDVPMLIEALRSTSDSLIAGLEPMPKSAIDARTSLLYENMTGRLNVEIPRNTWIKNDDMRVEMSGEIDIVKTGDFFELFGNIDIIRGHYILYGRKLNVQESQIIFQGGEKLDPTLNISAEYIFRDSDKEKRYLELLINGEISEPEITFILDGSEISETDGISILIFGTTTDEIGYGGQNGLISSVGSNAVASILTSQLSRTIGTQLNLDMIEITATESWQSAAFMVGKYITNDIFIVYQRGFGEVEDDEITPETITIEYEINEKLFLRLQSGSAKTSGMDVILKFEEGKPIFKKRKLKKTDDR